MTFKTRATATVTALALTLSAPLAVMSGAVAAQQTEPSQTLTAGEVTDAQITAFIDALFAVEEVRREYIPQIKAAEDEDAQQAVLEQADAAAIDAVRQTEDITPEEYVALVQSARADDTLNERITARIKTRTNQ